MGHYEKHLFFCVNQKADGKKCCQDADAMVMCQYAKQKLKALARHGKGQFRVSHSGCLGRCAQGPSLVIYPEGIWYTYQNKTDIDEIICEYLLKGNVVTRLLMDKLNHDSS